MSYDEGLAERVRELLDDVLVEKKMFGGLAFLLNGNMAVGVVADSLIVRVAPEEYGALLTEPGAGLMDFTGKPMKGWLTVRDEGIAEDSDLASWVDRGLSYASSLPPK